MRETLMSSNDVRVAIDLGFNVDNYNDHDGDGGYKDDDDNDDDPNRNKTTINDEKNYHDNNNNNNNDNDEDSWYGEYYKSLRTDTGLEIGCIITWPNFNDNDTTAAAADDDNDDDEQNIQQQNQQKQQPQHVSQQQRQQQQQQQLTISTCLPETSIAPMFHGTQWAGTRLWRASIVATKYILELYRSNVFDWNENTIIIELGCGLGVPGMILHNKINCYTILTDKGDLIEQIQTNLYTNFPTSTVPSTTTTTTNTTKLSEEQLLSFNIESSSNNNNNNNNINNNDSNSGITKVSNNTSTTTTTTTSSTIQVQSLDWSIEGISELVQTINKIQQKILLLSTTTTKIVQQQQQQEQPTTSTIVILCCDCIYEPLYGTSWKQLLLCQNELLRIYPTAYVLTSVERRKFDGIDQYLSMAKNYYSSSSIISSSSSSDDAAITKVEQIINVPFDYPSEIEMYQFYGNLKQKKTNRK